MCSIGMSNSNSSVRSNPWAAAAATAARLAFVSSQNLRHLASARSAIHCIPFWSSYVFVYRAAWGSAAAAGHLGKLLYWEAFLISVYKLANLLLHR